MARPAPKKYRKYFANEYDSIYEAWKRGPDVLGALVFAHNYNEDTVRNVIDRAVKFGSPQPKKRGSSHPKMILEMDQ